MKESSTDQALDTLSNEIKRLNRLIDKQLSIKQNLARSIVQGAGYAIGATMIASVVLAIVSFAVSSVKHIPVLGGYIPDSSSESQK